VLAEPEFATSFQVDLPGSGPMAYAPNDAFRSAIKQHGVPIALRLLNR